MLKEMGHRLAPHIIIGHHFGEIRGEWKALEMVTHVGVETIVLVILKRSFLLGKIILRFRTQMKRQKFQPLLASSIPRFLFEWLYPSGSSLEGGDREGIHPLWYQYYRVSPPGTIDYAKEIGLETKFIEMCCSLIN